MRTYTTKYILVITLELILAINYALASDTNDSIPSRTIHRLGIELHPSYVIPTHKFLRGKNLNGEPIRFAISGHLKYAFRFKEDSRFHKMYPHAYQGIGISYGTFINAPELGSPFGIYAYQGSRIKEIRKNLTLDYEWSFGVTFGWNEFHVSDNRYNHVIGTDIDAYMNLGVMLNWQLSSTYHLTTGLSLSHFSNANTHYPNQGVNIIESKIGLVKTLGETNDRGEFKRSTYPTLRDRKSVV